MKIQEIREMIKLVDQSSIEEFVYESEGTKVKMKKTGGAVQAAAAPAPTPAAAPAPAPAPAPAAKPEPETEAVPADTASSSSSDSLTEIPSPMVGTFYQSPSPEEPAFVKVGDKVSAETVVCIVEAMKLFNEIEAETEGEIAEILVKDGQLVEYGQPLFLVKTK
ncbi:acetyl-CoA carboxylase biotin carboxyl carrier protein [Planococcus lenghuensis]|uniref:Biotin carboxyl carrier protein of acetyl-CoA carboxylase n=1 Tax=Planococcus lenghuensis TaxID=2213202 RepID=A0A1Q2KXU9_9BACL|nr:acetyl-CoA carboxylase biotin carboxyl carrier protein [Planococcus lenghuensis]AQQ53019.1 acetyl-CoA carboxylase, biotin carboxyl carrier protein [Planococcus lenghuensis]